MPIFLFFFPVISVHKTSLNIISKVKTNLLHFGEGVCVHGREMEDENHGNRTDGHGGGSPENPCLKSCSGNNHNSKEQEHFFPIANVGRVMNKAIPDNGKISKESVQERVIGFVTGEASDKCQREKRDY